MTPGGGVGGAGEGVVTGGAGQEWRVVEVDAAATWALRQEVLRAGRADRSVRLRADSARPTRHFAVLDHSEQPIGVATVIEEPCPVTSPAPGAALRLAMMAVHPGYQGRAVGTARSCAG